MHNYNNFKKRPINLVYTKLVRVCLIIISLISLTALVGCSSKNIDAYVGLSAKQIYSQGKEHAEEGNFSVAIKDFEALESNYPYGDYSDKAKLALIHAYYGKKEYLQAKAAADRFIRMYPNHPNVDYAHFMQGLAGYDQYYTTMYKMFRIDRSRREPTFAVQSFDDFKILLEKFPTSKYAQDTRQRMIHLRNQLALYNLYIAEYYLAKKAYIASANRANLIVSDFDGTVALESALKIMIQAYRSLGMPELEKNSINLLNVNFGSISSNSATE
ncbi:MAG: outer membrane protein assembly factor BamD [Gammaproteobacteria bacterium]|jgi:outer membrane protein assembly factor BamD